MFFGSFWDLLAKTNEEWAAERDERGRTPLLVASGAMQEAWRTIAKARTKNLDHTRCENRPTSGVDTSQ